MDTMRTDLLTLYMLGFGTLLMGSAMLLWERRSHPRRGREFALWATGVGALALGCVLGVVRTRLPGLSGWAASQLAFDAGYLLILLGVGRLNGRRYDAFAVACVASVVLVWSLLGGGFRDLIWNYGASTYICLISALTGWEIWRGPVTRRTRVRPVAAGIMAVHAGFNAARALVFPVLAFSDGLSRLGLLAVIAMFEGVLYAVATPPVLLALVREETLGHLIADLNTDYLTGLGNRQFFFEEGPRRLRAGGPAALLAFDLDHFKHVNDTHGHEAGDKVLRCLAQVLRDAAGENAVLARLGGEEFAALLPGLDGVAARELGEQMAERLAATVLQSELGAIRVTVSIGVAERENRDDDLAMLLRRADRALYRAKALGRNRVEGGAATMGAASGWA